MTRAIEKQIPCCVSPWFFLFAVWACANSLAAHTFRIAKIFLPHREDFFVAVRPYKRMGALHAHAISVPMSRCKNFQNQIRAAAREERD